MNTQTVLESLICFRSHADEDVFKDIFGGSLGEHLWEKYRTVQKYDILKFYSYLDLENRRKFAEALIGNTPGNTGQGD